nr:MAG TPA: hypothetical protein [Caudoviricetes sp.]
MIASLFYFPPPIPMLLKIQYFEEIIYMRLYECIKFCTFSQ